MNRFFDLIFDCQIYLPTVTLAVRIVNRTRSDLVWTVSKFEAESFTA